MVLPCLAASAVTFTNDTAIASYDTNYDGLDITVTNCTVTVDGVHSFASLQVLSGGAVTHSAGEDGTIHNWFVVSNELQVLSATNVAVLSNANVVLASVVVQDLSGQITYSNGVDYTLGSAGGNLTTLLLTQTSRIESGTRRTLRLRDEGRELGGARVRARAEQVLLLLLLLNSQPSQPSTS